MNTVLSIVVVISSVVITIAGMVAFMNNREPDWLDEEDVAHWLKRQR